MSQVEREVPPAGEELHIPGQTIQPFLLAVFITVTLVGVTTAWWIVAAGGIGVLAVIVRWIRDARTELSELPLHDDPH